MLRFTSRAGRLPLALMLAALGACADPSDLTAPREPDVVDVDDVPLRGSLSGAGTTPWADGYLKTFYEDIPTPHQPSPSYSFNRAARFGGVMNIAKVAGATGRYAVTFPGLSAYLGSRSTLHVSTHYVSPEGTYCKPAAAYLVSDKVEVRCFKASTGAAANGNFSLTVTRSYYDVAFAYAHLETGTNYAPSSQGSWNPAGTSTVVRTGVGQYRVTFNNLGTLIPTGLPGHAQVNAVGTSNSYCNVFNAQVLIGTTNVAVDVRCFSPVTGAPIDRRFTVLYVVPADHVAYAWADKPTTASYSPLPYFSSNPSGGPITITRSGVGSYRVEWTYADSHILEEGNAQVTAYGSNALCRIITAYGSVAEVKCVSPAGTPADTRFSVLYTS